MKNSVRWLWLVCAVGAITVIIGSCKKDDDGTGPAPGGNITVSGTVQEFGGGTIANAVVQVYSGTTITGNPAVRDTTNATGQWQVVLGAAGRFTYVVTATAHPTAIVSLNIAQGQTTVNTGATVLASQTINGIVNDAQTGLPVNGAVVRFFSGSSSDTGGYRFPDVVTAGAGNWTGAFTIGTYVCAVYATGHVPLIANIPVTDTTLRQLTTTITQPVPAGQMRIVLNWGLQPNDLDSHLTGDSTTTAGRPRYHVYYANDIVTTASGDTIAYLDIDDVTSFGPETITIMRFFPGTLRYKIHDYTNRSVTGSHFMSDSSGATVRVYTSAGQIREDHIVTGVAGNQWYVYDINGTTRALTFVNTIRDGVSNPADSSFRAVPRPEREVRK